MRIMNAIEYKRTWENGQKNFAKMEHSKAICKLMDIELNDIIDFPNQPYEKIREYQLKKIIKLVDYAYKNIPLYREPLKILKNYHFFIKTSL